MKLSNGHRATSVGLAGPDASDSDCELQQQRLQKYKQQNLNQNREILKLLAGL